MCVQCHQWMKSSIAADAACAISGTRGTALSSKRVRVIDTASRKSLALGFSAKLVEYVVLLKQK